MIATLRGTLARVEASAVIVDVGGVGYRVSVPVSVLTVFSEGQTAFLHIHTHVRAEELSLFGFADDSDLRVFGLLLSVSGIGPKVALSILSAMDAGTLARAVASEDTKTLVRIPGLGLKTAQRLVLELRDKLSAFLFERRVDAADGKVAVSAEDDLLGDVTEGLVSLGYNRNDARKAADRAHSAAPAEKNMGALLKAALNILTGSGPKG